MFKTRARRALVYVTGAFGVLSIGTGVAAVYLPAMAVLVGANTVFMGACGAGIVAIIGVLGNDALHNSQPKDPAE